MYFDHWGFEHTQHLVIVEIFLLYAAVFERDFGFQGGGEAEDDAAFHLRFDDIGIDDAAAVYGAHDAVNFDVAVFLYAGFDDLRDIGFKRKVSGDSACDSFGKRLAPVGFFRGQVENSQHAGLFCEQLAAQFVGIFFARVSDFIEKKIEALRCHASQIGDRDIGEFMRQRTRLAGLEHDYSYAEAFHHLVMR